MEIDLYTPTGTSWSIAEPEWNALTVQTIAHLGLPTPQHLCDASSLDLRSHPAATHLSPEIHSILERWLCALDAFRSPTQHTPILDLAPWLFVIRILTPQQLCALGPNIDLSAAPFHDGHLVRLIRAVVSASPQNSVKIAIAQPQHPSYPPFFPPRCYPFRPFSFEALARLCGLDLHFLDSSCRALSGNVAGWIAFADALARAPGTVLKPSIFLPQPILAAVTRSASEIDYWMRLDLPIMAHALWCRGYRHLSDFAHMDSSTFRQLFDHTYPQQEVQRLAALAYPLPKPSSHPVNMFLVFVLYIPQNNSLANYPLSAEISWQGQITRIHMSQTQVGGVYYFAFPSPSDVPSSIIGSAALGGQQNHQASTLASLQSFTATGNMASNPSTTSQMNYRFFLDAGSHRIYQQETHFTHSFVDPVSISFHHEVSFLQQTASTQNTPSTTGSAALTPQSSWYDIDAPEYTCIVSLGKAESIFTDFYHWLYHPNTSLPQDLRNFLHLPSFIPSFNSACQVWRARPSVLIQSHMQPITLDSGHLFILGCNMPASVRSIRAHVSDRQSILSIDLLPSKISAVQSCWLPFVSDLQIRLSLVAQEPIFQHRPYYKLSCDSSKPDVIFIRNPIFLPQETSQHTAFPAHHQPLLSQEEFVTNILRLFVLGWNVNPFTTGAVFSLPSALNSPVTPFKVIHQLLGKYSGLSLASVLHFHELALPQCTTIESKTQLLSIMTVACASLLSRDSGQSHLNHADLIQIARRIRNTTAEGLQMLPMAKDYKLFTPIESFFSYSSITEALISIGSCEFLTSLILCLPIHQAISPDQRPIDPVSKAHSLIQKTRSPFALGPADAIEYSRILQLLSQSQSSQLEMIFSTGLIPLDLQKIRQPSSALNQPFQHGKGAADAIPRTDSHSLPSQQTTSSIQTPATSNSLHSQSPALVDEKKTKATQGRKVENTSTDTVNVSSDVTEAQKVFKSLVSISDSNPTHMKGVCDALSYAFSNSLKERQSLDLVWELLKIIHDSSTRSTLPCSCVQSLSKTTRKVLQEAITSLPPIATIVAILSKTPDISACSFPLVQEIYDEISHKVPLHTFVQSQNQTMNVNAQYLMLVEKRFSNYAVPISFSDFHLEASVWRWVENLFAHPESQKYTSFANISKESEKRKSMFLAACRSKQLPTDQLRSALSSMRILQTIYTGAEMADIKDYLTKLSSDTSEFTEIVNVFRQVFGRLSQWTFIKHILDVLDTLAKNPELRFSAKLRSVLSDSFFTKYMKPLSKLSHSLLFQYLFDCVYQSQGLNSLELRSEQELKEVVMHPLFELCAKFITLTKIRSLHYSFFLAATRRIAPGWNYLKRDFFDLTEAIKIHKGSSLFLSTQDETAFQDSLMLYYRLKVFFSYFGGFVRLCDSLKLTVSDAEGEAYKTLGSIYSGLQSLYAKYEDCVRDSRVPEMELRQTTSYKPSEIESLRLLDLDHELYDPLLSPKRHSLLVLVKKIRDQHSQNLDSFFNICYESIADQRQRGLVNSLQTVFRVLHPLLSLNAPIPFKDLVAKIRMIDTRILGPCIKELSVQIEQLVLIVDSVERKSHENSVQLVNSLQSLYAARLAPFVSDSILIGSDLELVFTPSNQEPLPYGMKPLYSRAASQKLSSKLYLVSSMPLPREKKGLLIQFLAKLKTLAEIASFHSRICISFHPEYVAAPCMIPLSKTDAEMQKQRNDLQEKLKIWEDQIETLRSSCPLINILTNSDIYYLLNNLERNKIDQSVSLAAKDTLPLYLPRLIKTGMTVKYVSSFLAAKTSSPCEDQSQKLMDASTSESGALERLKLVTQKLSTLWPRVDCAPAMLRSDRMLYRGKATLIHVESKSDPYSESLVLYHRFLQRLPHEWEVLVCSSETTEEQIQLFLRRCICDLSGVGDLFAVVGLEALGSGLQTLFCEVYESFVKKIVSPTFLLCIFASKDTESIISRRFHSFKKEVKLEMQERDKDAILSMVEQSGHQVFVLHSHSPRSGKTFTLRHLVQQQRGSLQDLVTISMPWKTPVETLSKALTCNSKDGQYVHLDLGMMIHQDINAQLYSLFILHHLRHARNEIFVARRNTVYLVEMPTAYDNQELHQRLVFLNIFRRVPLQPNFIAAISPSLPLIDLFDRQISVLAYVGLYLKAFKKWTLSNVRTIQSWSDMPNENESKDLVSEYAKGSMEEKSNFLRLMKYQIDRFHEFQERHHMTSAENLYQQIFQDIVTLSVALAKPTLTEEMNRGESTQTTAFRSFEVQREWSSMARPILIFHTPITGQFVRIDFSETKTQSTLSTSGHDNPIHLYQQDTFKLSRCQPNSYSDILAHILGQTPADVADRIASDPETAKFVFTPENFAKIMSIYCRIRAAVPVVIVGETGCGKTTVFKLMSVVMGIPLNILRIHGGVLEFEVRAFVKKQIKAALSDPDRMVFGFLDEINTSPLLGLFKEIVCDRTLDGISLPSNLVFVGACNPYRRKPRKPESAESSDFGLDPSMLEPNATPLLDDLVYSVHPLPVSIAHLAWDFGSLSGPAEKLYVEAIASRHISDLSMRKRLVIAINESQEFIRIALGENGFITLRDVIRTMTLVAWFERIEFPGSVQPSGRLGELWQQLSKVSKDTLQYRPFILALVCNYRFRLHDREMQKQYVSLVASIFGISLEQAVTLFRREQYLYVNQLQVPPNTVFNQALLENVFMSMVSTLNKISLLIIGSPGCSKSFALHLLKKSLHPLSKLSNPNLSSIDGLQFMTYQCSAESTSEGIIEVYNKAKMIKSEASIPVVVLDEIGLAARSEKMPLKVMHWLFEDNEVAFIGLSNWRIDEAKMNRTLFIVRPEPTSTDLLDIAMGLTNMVSADLRVCELEGIVSGYLELRNSTLSSIRKDFYGLRDFYFALRQLCVGGEYDRNKLGYSLARNFNGVMDKDLLFVKEAFRKHVPFVEDSASSVHLIAENLKDTASRHLLVVSGVFVPSVSLLFDSEILTKRDTLVCYASDFPEDQQEYSTLYLMGEIRTAMEKGNRVVLVDQHSIHEILYDLLNKQYVMVGDTAYCYLALNGQAEEPYVVHKNFKCIVIGTERDVYGGPSHGFPAPFLNRFEKHHLSASELVTFYGLQDSLEALQRLCDSHLISRIGQSASKAFPRINQESLCSLVIAQALRTLKSEMQFSLEGNPQIVEKIKDVAFAADFPEKCWDQLVWVANAAVVASSNSPQLQEHYVKRQCHDNLFKLLKYLEWKSCKQASSLLHVFCEGLMPSLGQLALHVDSLDIQPENAQLVNLGAFASSKLFREFVSSFYKDETKSLLIITCNLQESPIRRVIHAKYMCEDRHHNHYQSLDPVSKFVVFVTCQEGRHTPDGNWSFTFDTSWTLVNLDSILPQGVSLELAMGPFLAPKWLSCMKDRLSQIISTEFVNAGRRMFYTHKVSYFSKIQEARLLVGQTDFPDILATLLGYLINKVDGNAFVRELDTANIAKDMKLLERMGGLQAACTTRFSDFVGLQVAGLIPLLDCFENLRFLTMPRNEDFVDNIELFRMIVVSKLFWDAVLDIKNFHSSPHRMLVMYHESFSCQFPFSNLIFHHVEKLRGAIRPMLNTCPPKKCAEDLDYLTYKIFDCLPDFSLDQQKAYCMDLLFYTGTFTNWKAKHQAKLWASLLTLATIPLTTENPIATIHVTFWLAEWWLRCLSRYSDALPSSVIFTLTEHVDKILADYDKGNHRSFENGELLADALGFVFDNIYQDTFLPHGQISQQESDFGWHQTTLARVPILTAIVEALDSPLVGTKTHESRYRIRQVNAKILSLLIRLTVPNCVLSSNSIHAFARTMEHWIQTPSDWLDYVCVGPIIEALASAPMATSAEEKLAISERMLQSMLFDAVSPETPDIVWTYKKDLLTLGFCGSTLSIKSIKDLHGRPSLQREACHLWWMLTKSDFSIDEPDVSVQLATIVEDNLAAIDCPSSVYFCEAYEDVISSDEHVVPIMQSAVSLEVSNLARLGNFLHGLAQMKRVSSRFVDDIILHFDNQTSLPAEAVETFSRWLASTSGSVLPILWYICKSLYVRKGFLLTAEIVKSPSFRPFVSRFNCDPFHSINLGRTTSFNVMPLSWKSHLSKEKKSMFSSLLAVQPNLVNTLSSVSSALSNIPILPSMAIVASILEADLNAANLNIDAYSQTLSQWLRLNAPNGDLLHRLLRYESLVPRPDLRITNSSQTVLLRASVIMSFAALVLVKGPSFWPLEMLIHATLATPLFLPAMPDDPRFAELEAILIKDVEGAYLCPNGHVYSIANCTWPWVDGNCFKCGALIGGRGHIAHPGNVRVHRIPYGRINPDPSRTTIRMLQDVTELTPAGYDNEEISDTHTTRGMTVVEFRFIRILTHMCMIWHALGKPPATCFCTIEKAYQGFYDDWRVISQMLSLNDEDLSLLLRCMIFDLSVAPNGYPGNFVRVQERNEWENTFLLNFLRPFLATATQRLTNEKGLPTGEDQSPAQMMLEQSFEAISPDKQLEILPHICRPRQRLTDDYLTRRFFSLDQETLAKLPFLKIVFEQAAILRLVSGLPKLLELYHHFYMHHNQRLSKLDASSQEIVKVIDAFDNEREKELCHKILQDVVVFWNGISEILKTPGKWKRSNIHSLHTKDPIQRMLLSKSPSGRDVMEIMDAVVQLHNNLVRALPSDSPTPQEIPVTDVHSEHLVHFNFSVKDEKIQRFITRCSHTEPTPRGGLNVEIDWIELQRLLQFEFAQYKPLIKAPSLTQEASVQEAAQEDGEGVKTDAYVIPPIGLFQYSDEAAAVVPWDAFHFKIPRQPEKDKEVASIFAGLDSISEIRASRILQAVYLAIHLASLTGGDGNTSIQRFLEEMVTMRDVDELLGRACLCQAKAFEGAVIERVGAFGIINQQYKSSPDDSQTPLCEAFQAYVNKAAADQLSLFKDGWLSFMQDYLTEASYSPDTSLLMYLSGLGVDVPMEDEFPDVPLRFAVHFYKILDQTLQQRL
eukprot:TRINITY_DN3929_c0_g1_i2.p1 TRINITY_DN3929_c0_g1~~TRINITY_DN3929_c0_g1_i2.p1  ORF type:complete len:4951 (+),score=929.66 TRINITY_DN3929_c0_g1_i2:20-14872(+)